MKIIRENLFESCMIVFIFSVCTFAGAYIVNDIFYERPKRIEAAVSENASWIVSGCPVYKSSCGSSKAPYICERKAVVIGRNRVGDIFVDAYPICKK